MLNVQVIKKKITLSIKYNIIKFNHNRNYCLNVK